MTETPSAWFDRAVHLAAAARQPEALDALDRAIALDPAFFDAIQARANLLGFLGRLEEALDAFDRAIELRPLDADCHFWRGIAARRLNRVAEAIDSYDRAIALRNDHAMAWFNKALALLTLGRYAEAWPLYEWRWFIPGHPDAGRSFAQPMWDGAPFPGKTLLIHAEQGLGDTIHFWRFVAMAQRFGTVAVEVQAPLVTLLASQPGAPAVFPRGVPPPPFDLHCPIMSLPLLLGIGLDNIPPAPYLAAGPIGATGPRRQGRPTIGIVWAGGADHHNDRDRSMPLAAMLAMLDPSADVVSIQKDVSDADRLVLAGRPDIQDLSGAVAPFAAAAAVVSQLDLIISVDTSTAHLAAALGKPVWILLSFAGDWRWMLGREDTPWYGSARLFRQDRPGDWTGVAERVRAALREFHV